MSIDDEERLLRQAALQNVQSILQARQRAEQELLKTKEALEEETRVLELLNKTGAALASNLDLQRVVQTATEAALELGGAELGLFLQKEGDAFRLRMVSGGPQAPFEAWPASRAAGVLRIADVGADPRGAELGLPPEVPVASYLAVPVIARSGEVMGELCFGHREPNVFTERAERLIVGIAAQAAIAIDNARLYEEARGSADERARLLEAERAARVEVERAGIMKDEFVATLSHELRSPLNAVMGWAQILLARAPEGSDLRRGLEVIARNARAQTQLIDDLLDMNRIVSGKIRLDVQRLELAGIVESTLESVRPSAEAKAITIRKTIDPHAGPVFGDPNRIQQILWNLLNNAVKFTPKGGKLDVLVQRVNSHVEITVHDTGIGIHPDFLPHLWERFRQADSSSTRKHGGLGLGLSIVKELVVLHGGSVTAESPGEDKGSTFRIFLPLRAVHEASAPARVHPTTPRAASPDLVPVSLAGIKVLVVDDEIDAREVVESVLLDAGAEVLTAVSAEDGIGQVIAHRPDVIVSDIGMPQRDGYHFISAVRALPAEQGGRTPAVALTAFARSEDRTRAMLAGYQLHTSKPIEALELVATVKSLADRRP